MARKKTDEQPQDDSVVVSAAKAIGTAAGKIASLAGAAPAKPAKAKVEKLAPKNKSRLPRKQKKAQQKAAAGRPPAK